MQAWAGMVVGCCLVVGCGGAVSNEASAGEKLAVASSDMTAHECRPKIGGAERVKVIMPPSQFPPRLANAPESLVEFRDELFFGVNFEDGHSALWRSDGTEAGTVEVRDFPFIFSRVRTLTPAEDRLFFVASEPATGEELWVSDGTTGGTRLVEDLTPGPDSTSLSNLTGLGRVAVFFREGPISPEPRPIELWRSDGSAEGTQRLLALEPGTSVSFQQLQFDDTLLFFTSNASRGTELWRTDGTSAGTVRVRRLDAGQTFISDVRSDGTTGLFTLDDAGDLTEVWKTDGTTAGTVRIKTFGPSVAVGLLGAIEEYVYLTLSDFDTRQMRLYRIRLDGTGGREFVATLPNPFTGMTPAFPSLSAVSQADDRIYFSIFHSSDSPAPRDTQLWVTDGTRSGTRLLRRPLSLSDEYGSPVYAVSDRLAFFASFDEDTGIEPWVTDGTVRGTRILRNIGPDTPPDGSSYPRSYIRVGDRVFFTAFDDTLANQLWAVPLLNACLAPEREPGASPASTTTSPPRAAPGSTSTPSTSAPSWGTRSTPIR